MSHISNIVYALRQQYGSCIHYVEILSSDIDRTTGSRTIQKKASELEIVHLPASLIQKFIQDIGYLAANKNFTYGAVNEFQTIGFLLMDLTFNPDLDGYVIWNDERHEKVSVDNFNNGEVYLLQVKATKNSRPYDVERAYANNTLQIAGAATYELN